MAKKFQNMQLGERSTKLLKGPLMIFVSPKEPPNPSLSSILASILLCAISTFFLIMDVRENIHIEKRIKGLILSKIRKYLNHVLLILKSISPRDPISLRKEARGLKEKHVLTVVKRVTLPQVVHSPKGNK